MQSILYRSSRTALQTGLLKPPYISTKHIQRLKCQALDAYWTQFWTKEPDPPPSDLGDILQYVPRYNIPACPLDVNLWHQAIKALKPHSARGVDCISAQELKVLPHRAIEDLMHILATYTSGFPLWLMWVKTCPVPKKPGLIDPSLVRPISVMSQLYRLWARVQCRHVIQHLSQKITPEITGFLPSRGPYDAIYEFQWLLEQAHNGQGHRSGISIDLLKCFNTIDREAA